MSKCSGALCLKNVLGRKIMMEKRKNKKKHERMKREERKEGKIEGNPSSSRKLALKSRTSLEEP